MDKLDINNCVLDEKVCMEMSGTCACFNLRRAARLVSQAFDEALRPSGLKITQFSLLVAAFMLDNLVLTKLAKVMGMDRTTLSRNLKLLEKKGLIRLEQGEDRREVRTSLTPQGKQALEKAAPLWYEVQSRITNGLGDEKWASMLADFRSISAALKK